MCADEPILQAQFKTGLRPPRPETVLVRAVNRQRSQVPAPFPTASGPQVNLVKQPPASFHQSMTGVGHKETDGTRPPPDSADQTPARGARYVLYIEEQQQGPYDKKEVLAMLAHGTITRQTPCRPEDGASVWGFAGDLDDTTGAKRTGAGSSALAEPQIARRSGWSEFMNGAGLFILLSGCVAAWVVGNSEGKDTGFEAFIILACCVVGAVQAFFCAFLVNVFTDIRWFLKKLADERGRNDV